MSATTHTDDVATPPEALQRAAGFNSQTATSPTSNTTMTYRVEASQTDPSIDHCVTVDTGYANRPLHASRSALAFLKKGYWVEVLDDRTQELLAGPFDPDQPPPTYIV